MRSKNNIAKNPYSQKAPLIENGRQPHLPLFPYFLLDKGIREGRYSKRMLLRNNINRNGYEQGALIAR